jgi:hypothetical protein
VDSGVTVIASNGATYVSALDRIAFAPGSAPPLVVSADSAAAGLRVGALVSLVVFGSQDDGWTSRTTSSGDVFVRMIDAQSRVRDVAALRALATGQTMALLLRDHGAPDAVVLSSDFGRSWLGDQVATPTGQLTPVPPRPQ